MSASGVLDMQGDRLHGQRYAFYFQYQEKEAFLRKDFLFNLIYGLRLSVSHKILCALRVLCG